MQNTSSNTSKPSPNLAENENCPDAEDSVLELKFKDMSDNRVHIPPPRIAARFYRLTLNHCRSSAAPSRRESFSSAHPHQSTTRHGEIRSSFVAQHQRRNYLIEKKKAKFAVRAAHAEQVRLRAAFFKATLRSTKKSQEKVLAAQRAREKFLTDIATSCAEEVKKAKSIAESMKEKREVEMRKLRKHIEERLAEAEKRREKELRKCSGLKRRRAPSCCCKDRSLGLKTQEKISMGVAASQIQKHWRIYQRKKVVKEFRSLALTVKSIKRELFDHVAKLLEQTNIITSTAAVLKVCGLKYSEAQSNSGMSNVRIFLCSYIILGHPKQIFSTKMLKETLPHSSEPSSLGKDDLSNTQAQDLIVKAQDLLTSFEKIIFQLNPLNDYIVQQSQQSELQEAYNSFFSLFVAWKAHDSEALIDMLLLQFIELEKLWLSVRDKSEERVTDSYKNGIRENQIMIMARIKKFAGEKRCKEMVSRALREAHLSQPDRQLVKKTRSHGKTTSELKKQSTNSFAMTEKAMAAALHTLTPPIETQSNVISNIDIIRFAHPVMQNNRVITHEIAIDKEYRISEELIGTKSTNMQSAFDNMRNDIKAGNSDAWVLAMVENVRTKLQKLLTEGKPMHASIGEWLDHDLISTQLQHQSFSYNKFFEEIGRLLPNLCAPFRDKQIQQIVQENFQENDVVSRLEALMYALDLLQLDYANFLLQRQIPLILANAVKYEKYQFMHQLTENGGSLQWTETAWKQAQDNVVIEISKRDPENINSLRNKPTAEKIYMQMLVDVFTVSNDENRIPETLELDRNRIIRIRSDILRILTCGAILLQCKNILKRDVRSSWKVEGTGIYIVLENAKSNEQAIQGIQAALEGSRSMSNAAKNFIRNFVSRIVTVSDSRVSDPRDPVLRLLMNRLRGYFLSKLVNRGEKDKNKISNTSQSLITLGLPEYSQKISEIIHEIGRVAAVDREAHGKWYEQIYKKFDNESTDPEKIQNTNKMEIDQCSIK